MYKKIIPIFLILLGMALISGSNHSDWDAFVEGEDDAAIETGNDGDDQQSETTTTISESKSSSSNPESKYTQEFYIASGVAVFGAIIIGYLIYVMFRGPKNQFKK